MLGAFGVTAEKWIFGRYNLDLDEIQPAVRRCYPRELERYRI